MTVKISKFILDFLIKPFLPNMSGQKFKYLTNNEMSIQDEIKTYFIIFKGHSLKQTKATFLDGKNPTLEKPAAFRMAFKWAPGVVGLMYA